MKLLVINGVNLNLTGQREKGVYGSDTLEELNAKIAAYCKKTGDTVDFYQNNIEGELVNKLHAAKEEGYDGVLLNAGAYTHYSYAIRDAVAAITIPVAEVHMSNVFAREDFRKESVLSPVCKGTVFGFGLGSYLGAIEGLRTYIEKDTVVDEKYIQALQCVVEEGKATISLIQRKCEIGFNMAGKIMEWMEEKGYISPFDGTPNPRKVLISKADCVALYGEF